MTYKPPPAHSPESYDHVCTLQSCHGAVVAPLSEVPQEGSPVFSLFFLIKLHLASRPLASSYSRVTVSSVFCAQNIFFGPSVWGPIDSDCCHLPTTSVHSSGQITLQSVLINKSYIQVSQGHTCTEIRKIEIPRSMVMEACRW